MAATIGVPSEAGAGGSTTFPQVASRSFLPTVHLAPLPPVPVGLRRMGSCSEALLRDLVFAQPVAIDEIQVVVERGDTAAVGDGMVRVEVEAGGSSRRLAASPSGAQGMRFAPALHGDRVRVTLDPVMASSLDSCVVRVDLYAGGQLITSVHP